MFYDEKLKRFRDVGETDDNEKQAVIPDGGGVNISLMLMDSAQRELVRASKHGLTPDDLNAAHNAYWGQ